MIQIDKATKIPSSDDQTTISRHIPGDELMPIQISSTPGTSTNRASNRPSKPVTDGWMFNDPGSVTAYNKKKKKRNAKIKARQDSIADLSKHNYKIKLEVAETFEKTVLQSDKSDEYLVIIGDAHVTSKEFAECLDPENGEVCKSFMWVCSQAMMLDWTGDNRIILDPISVEQLVMSLSKADKTKIDKMYGKADIKKINRIYLCVLEDKHWFLIYIDTVVKMIEVYDSIRGQDARKKDHAAIIRNVRQNLQDFYTRHNKDIPVKEFADEYPLNPMQENEHDCGFCVLRMLESHNGKAMSGYSTFHMLGYRKLLSHLLVNHRWNALHPAITKIDTIVE